MEIRPARTSDGPAVAALTAQLGYDPAGIEERLPDLLERPEHRVLVAAEEGRVIGWIHVHEVHDLELPPYASIAGLVIDEGRRRSGVGAALLDAAEDWARGRGMTSLRLRSNQIRTGAHAFYLARGYTIEKTQLAFLKRF